MIDFRVYARLLRVPLFMTLAQLIVFPLLVYASPPESKILAAHSSVSIDPASPGLVLVPGKASQPSRQPSSQTSSQTNCQTNCPPISQAMDGYDVPSWADLVILADAEPGPVLMVIAAIHGDEASGPRAASHLIAGPPPARGILVILPVASPEALAAGQRWLPGWSDLNRAFPETGEGGAPPAARVSGIAEVAGTTGTAGAVRSLGSAQSTGSAYAATDPTYQRADEILALIASIKPDLLLDLHESDQYWTEGDGPALVVPASARSAELALEVLESPGLDGFAFTGPPPAGSLVAAVDGLLGIPALLVEVPDALAMDDRLAVHLAVVSAAMRVLGMGCLGISCLGSSCQATCCQETGGLDSDDPDILDTDGYAGSGREPALGAGVMP